MVTEINWAFSEFTYGFGVIHEIINTFSDNGLKCVPYQPNLRVENEVGYDVALDKPGKPILIQFKLGQKMRRYRPLSGGAPASQFPINGEYYRFKIPLNGDAGTQYRLLLEHENSPYKFEVYYMAPIFSDWDDFSNNLDSKTIYENSLIIKPSEIASAITTQTLTGNVHQVAYNAEDQYVCSEPTKIEKYDILKIAEKSNSELKSSENSLLQNYRNSFMKVLETDTVISKKLYGSGKDENDTNKYFEYEKEKIKNWKEKTLNHYKELFETTVPLEEDEAQNKELLKVKRDSEELNFIRKTLLKTGAYIFDIQLQDDSAT